MRNRVFPSLLGTLLLASVTAHAQAQTCLGLPAFTHGTAHVNVAAERPDSASAWLVGLGAGRHNDAFGNVGGGQVSYEGVQQKSTLGFLELGYQVPLVFGLQLCPVAGGYIGVGPDDPDAGVRVTTRGASFGFALGVPLIPSLADGMLGLLPNVAVRYNVASIRVDEEDVEPIRESTGDAMIDLGVSLLVARRFSIQPVLHIPLGRDAGASSAGVFAAFGLGSRR
jgi:hypothetical protein